MWKRFGGFYSSKKRLLLVFLLSSFIIISVAYLISETTSPSTALRPPPPRIAPSGRQPTSLTPDQISLRFKQRVAILNAACEFYKNSSQFHNLQHEYTRKSVRFPPVLNSTVTYCIIEKTASTTWKGVFKTIAEKIGQFKTQKHKPQVLTPVPPEVRFVFVREPYARLLSAYVNKLFSPNTVYWKNIGRYIIQKFRKNPSEQSLRCGHDVTFPEFVRYVIHSQTTLQQRDGHFAPTHDHCHFCRQRFTHVGHLETLATDLPFLLEAMGARVNLEVVGDFPKQTIASGFAKVFRQPSSKFRGCMTKHEAALRVWKSMQLRGIISKEQGIPVGAGQLNGMSSTTFVRLAWAALARSGPKEERKLQKEEALIEAFSSVPLGDRLHLQNLLTLDFALFGFNSAPQTVFPTMPVRPPGPGEYSYLNVQRGPELTEKLSS